MPNPPTRGTKTSGMNGGTFQDEGCNDPRKEASKAMVIEYGIKSPSLSNGNQGRPDAGPEANTVKC